MYTKVKKDGTPAKKAGPKRANVEVPGIPEAPRKICKPVNYGGFLTDVIRSPETGARYEFSDGCLFVKIGMEEVVLEPSAWRKLIDEIPKAAEVLGVEL